MNQVGHMFCNQRDKYESGCGRRDCVCQGLHREVSACSVGWFISLLVHLYKREVLLIGSDKQELCEGAGSQPQPLPSAYSVRMIAW